MRRSIPLAEALESRRLLSTTIATSLSSFDGIENPEVTYDPTTKVFSPNTTFTNIADEGGGEFRFSLRYDPPTLWDGNLGQTSGSSSTDRQRAEVKGLGPHQQLGQTFEYSFSFETDPNFVGTSGFCHIFQLKALDSSGSDPGDSPMVTLSLGSNNQGKLELYSNFNSSGSAQTITIARTFTYANNTWMTARIDITTSTGQTSDGSVMASIDGDPMQGVSNVPVYVQTYDNYRPKWGFYRGINYVSPTDPGSDDWYIGTDYIQDENISATQIVSGKPTITTDPASQTVDVGTTVTFTAAASGNPMPTVQWQVSVTGAPFANITGNASATTPTLTLSSVTTQQSGNEYQAVFTNTQGSATTTAATLTVNPIIVDDKQATLVGTWTSSTYTPGYYGADYLTDGNTGKGAKSATFTPDLPVTGTYDVFARWTIGSNRATKVPFIVTSASGSSTVYENEQTQNGTWVLLGTYSFNGGTGGNVKISNAGTTGYVIADAVEFSLVTPIIIDDKQATLTGTWTSSTYTPGYYGTDYLTDGNTGKRTKTATFTPDLPTTGTYNVYARWTAGTNRATNVPFDVLHPGITTTLLEDQQINGSQWVLLGAYTFDAGTGGNVTIRTTGTNGYVIADAVEFVPVS